MQEFMNERKFMTFTLMILKKLYNFCIKFAENHINGFDEYFGVLYTAVKWLFNYFYFIYDVGIQRKISKILLVI